MLKNQLLQLSYQNRFLGQSTAVLLRLKNNPKASTNLILTWDYKRNFQNYCLLTNKQVKKGER